MAHSKAEPFLDFLRRDDHSIAPQAPKTGHAQCLCFSWPPALELHRQKGVKAVHKHVPVPGLKRLFSSKGCHYRGLRICPQSQVEQAVVVSRKSQL